MLRGKPGPARARDLGLLLLRLGFGGSILVIYGIPKIGAWLGYLHTGHWVFVDFNRRVGLPFPVLVAVLQTLNESVATLLVACGLFTRCAAVALVVGFTAATISSLVAGEAAWLMAAYFAVAFGSIALTGPGTFALDRLRLRPLSP